MGLNELLDAMQDEMHSAHEEIEKFMGGNKSAGTRARKSMQSIKEAAQSVRLQIQEIKNNS
jgi:class 3 adenylate cyclase